MYFHVCSQAHVGNFCLVVWDKAMSLILTFLIVSHLHISFHSKSTWHTWEEKNLSREIPFIGLAYGQVYSPISWLLINRKGSSLVWWVVLSLGRWYGLYKKGNCANPEEASIKQSFSMVSTSALSVQTLASISALASLMMDYN